MLVLSRRFDQRILIYDRETGEEIWVHVVQCNEMSRKVKLGITADDRFAIHREEFADAIKRNGGTL